MHRSEERNIANCLDCGTQLEPARERGYTFGSRGVLCFECAVRRGGSWDGTHEHWDTEPSIEGLEEAYEG